MRPQVECRNREFYELRDEPRPVEVDRSPNSLVGSVVVPSDCAKQGQLRLSVGKSKLFHFLSVIISWRAPEFFRNVGMCVVARISVLIAFFLRAYRKP